MDNQDPFLEVQADVQTTLTQTRHLFSSFLRIRTLTSQKLPTKPSEQLLESRTELLTNLDTLTTDLADLLESIRAVESDPYRYGLDVAEVQRRHGFVREVSGEVENMRRELNNDMTSVNGSGAGLPHPDAFHDNTISAEGAEDEEDTYAAFEQEQQMTMMREQEDQMDDVGRTIGVLRGQAEDMGRELEEQGVMLDEVDTLADRVGGKLAVGTKKIGEVIRRNEDRWSGFCIGALIFVLILLLIIVIVI